MGSRFRMLGLIGLVFKILAWFSLALGLLGAIAIVLVSALGMGAMMGDTPLGTVTGLGTGIAMAIATIFGAVVYFVILYATAEAIDLAKAIEQNTRETAYYLRGERDAAQSQGY